MVPVKVLTLIATEAPSPSILVLQPIEETITEGVSRVVPIYVGVVEALNLGIALENTRLARPTTHDLMLDMLTNLDARIDHVYIHENRGTTFFSKLVIAQHDRLIELDARPSDAIALAIRQEMPVYINERVLEATSFPYLYKEPLSEDQIVDDFKKFLDTINPEDFAE